MTRTEMIAALSLMLDTCGADAVLSRLLAAVEAKAARQEEQPYASDWAHLIADLERAEETADAAEL